MKIQVLVSSIGIIYRYKLHSTLVVRCHYSQIKNKGTWQMKFREQAVEKFCSRVLRTKYSHITQQKSHEFRGWRFHRVLIAIMKLGISVYSVSFRTRSKSLHSELRVFSLRINWTEKEHQNRLFQQNQWYTNRLRFIKHVNNNNLFLDNELRQI